MTGCRGKSDPNSGLLIVQTSAPGPAPAKLRDLAQWLVWRAEKHAGDKKPRKMPYYANGKRRYGEQGSDQDRGQLVAWSEAIEVTKRGPYDGLGFAFLPGDGLIGIDLDNAIDPETGEISARAQKIIDACMSYTELSPSRCGVHIFVHGECESFKSNQIGVEVFCGRQFFTFTGWHYPGTPETVNAVKEGVLRRLKATVDEAKGRRAHRPRSAPPQASDKRAMVESALAVVSSDCGYDDWIAIGMAIHADLGAGAIDTWDYWSSKSAKYPGRKTLETHWKSFDASGGVTGATLYKFAKDAGWQAPRGARVVRTVASAPHNPLPVEEHLPKEFSEDRIARIFTKLHGAKTRHVHVWGLWLIDDGQCWRNDNTLKHFDLARRVCRDVANDVRENSKNKNRDRIATLIESARTVAAVVKLASADRVHAAEVDAWDQDPWLLNTPGGLVDLRTGRLGLHRPDAFCTKMTAVSPRGKCPLWFAFLNRITGGDRRLIAYLQRLVGYALTGITREHTLAFFSAWVQTESPRF